MKLDKDNHPSILPPLTRDDKIMGVGFWVESGLIIAFGVTFFVALEAVLPAIFDAIERALR